MGFHAEKPPSLQPVYLIRRKFKKNRQKYKYWNSGKNGTYIKQPSKGYFAVKFHSPSSKIESRNGNYVPSSKFGKFQL